MEQNGRNESSVLRVAALKGGPMGKEASSESVNTVLFGKTIVLDARWIFDDLSGIGVYTRELIRAMPAQAPDCRFRLWFGDAARLAATRVLTGFDRQSNVSAEVVSEGLFSLKGQLRLPGKLRADGADLFHSPNYMIPLRAFPRKGRGPVACVTTIHDLIPLKLPDHAPRSKKSRLMPIYRRLMMEVARMLKALG